MQEYESQKKLYSASSVAVDALVAAAIIELNESINSFVEGTISRALLNRRVRQLLKSVNAKASTIAFEAIKRIFSPFSAPEGDSAPHSDFYKDIIRNLNEYDASPKDASAVNKLKMRLGFVISTAARLSLNKELEDEATYLSGLGFPIQKVWHATFIDNAPCPECVALNNTSVPLGESFLKTQGSRVYQKVTGPPLHPRCKCYLSIYLMTDEPLKLEKSKPVDRSFTTDDIKSMSRPLFDSFLKVFQRIRKLFKR